MFGYGFLAVLPKIIVSYVVGLGYAKILVIVAFFRELLGSGTLLGFNILNYEAVKNAGYVNNGLMLMPPMALIIVACLIWYQRAKHKELQEKE
jgi:Na+-transporting NADH:ubiquinone oxidoreductase subunit D